MICLVEFIYILTKLLKMSLNSIYLVQLKLNLILINYTIIIVIINRTDRLIIVIFKKQV